MEGGNVAGRVSGSGVLYVLPEDQEKFFWVTGKFYNQANESWSWLQWGAEFKEIT